MKNTAIPLVIGTLALAGCGGSGGGDDCTPGEFCDIAEKVLLTLDQAELGDVDDAAELADPEATLFEDLPIGGSATYDGFLQLQLQQDGELVIGDATVEATFGTDAGTFSGTADGFVGSSTGRYAGTIELEDGLIIQGAEAFVDEVGALAGIETEDTTNGEDFAGIVVDMTGDLTSSTDVEIAVDGVIFGTFIGEDASMIGAAIGASGLGTVSGVFVAVDTDANP